MAESPTKRRRLDVDEEQPRIHNDEVESDIDAPKTPTRRASYLSPTKASLARSHPDIFAKSPKRGSLTEPRGKLLRQELLGSRKKSIGGSPPKTAPRPTQTAQNIDPDTGATPVLEKDGFAEAIAQTLQNTTMRPPTQQVQSRSARSPLLTRQPFNTVTGKRSREDKASSKLLSDLPIPKLVKNQQPPARQPSEARSEPELPPTPVQLGIGTVPDRPRGLASSSSIGSRSGSGRRRRRVREGGTAVTSSPLKPKNRQPVSPPDFSDVEEPDNEVIEEAAESDIEESQVQRRGHREEIIEDQSQIPPSEDTLEKQGELTDLRAELEKLRADLTRLESLADQLSQEAEIDVDVDEPTLELLKLESRDTRGDLQSPDSHPVFTQNPTAFLTLFTPGNLSFKHQTSTKHVQKRLKVIHNLKLVAPAPWPAEAMDLSFDIQIDAEDAQINSLAQSDSRSSQQCGSLQKWITSRLNHPLHEFDIAGIVWGSGQYFKACIARAGALYSLDRQYNKSLPAIPNREHSKDPNDQDIPALLRYLHRTQLLIVLPEKKDPSAARNAKSGTKSKQILVSYDINLTWTGEAVTNIDISLAVANGKVQTGIKELFGKLLPTEGVVGAVETVCRVMGNDHEVAVSNKQAPRARNAIDA